MKYLYLLIALISFTFPAQAQEYGVPIQGYYADSGTVPANGYTTTQNNQNLEEYFAANNPDYNRSIIYIFFNNEPCYTCAQAISMIEQIYNRNFSNMYSLLMINYYNDQENEFIQTYNLSQPLEVVLVRINDGASFGYKKLENLQNQISDPVSFEENFINQVNNYLGNW